MGGPSSKRLNVFERYLSLWVARVRDDRASGRRGIDELARAGAAHGVEDERRGQATRKLAQPLWESLLAVE
jgi:hypothetical protein